LARRQHAFRDHRADDGAVHAGLEAIDRRDGARVLVAMGDVEQKVAGGHHAKPTQRRGTHRSDPLEVRDRGIEIQALLRARAARHSVLNSSRENSAGSKETRSDAASPTPRNLTGTSIASCTATTTPPRAVPSSFVTTRPVTGTAAANVLACCTA